MSQGSVAHNRIHSSSGVAEEFNTELSACEVTGSGEPQALAWLSKQCRRRDHREAAGSAPLSGLASSRPTTSAATTHATRVLCVPRGPNTTQARPAAFADSTIVPLSERLRAQQTLQLHLVCTFQTSRCPLVWGQVDHMGNPRLKGAWEMCDLQFYLLKCSETCYRNSNRAQGAILQYLPQTYIKFPVQLYVMW